MGATFSEAEVYGGLSLIRPSFCKFCNVRLRAGKRRDAITTTSTQNDHFLRDAKHISSPCCSYTCGDAVGKIHNDDMSAEITWACFIIVFLSR